jgi:hypothetical protein
VPPYTALNFSGRASRSSKAVLYIVLLGAILCLQGFNHQTSKIAAAFQTITDDTRRNVVPADCASWVAKYSEKGDELLFLTDDVLPGYPLILQMVETLVAIS